MRELIVEEVQHVAGGYLTDDDDLPIKDPMGGLFQVIDFGMGGGMGASLASVLGKIAAEIGKAIGGGLAYDYVKDAVMSHVGVSGANGNENDNGGTSYGIGIFNTFGSDGSWWGGNNPYK